MIVTVYFVIESSGTARTSVLSSWFNFRNDLWLITYNKLLKVCWVPVTVHARTIFVHKLSSICSVSVWISIGIQCRSSIDHTLWKLLLLMTVVLWLLVLARSRLGVGNMSILHDVSITHCTGSRVWWCLSLVIVNIYVRGARGVGLPLDIRWRWMAMLGGSGCRFANVFSTTSKELPGCQSTCRSQTIRAWTGGWSKMSIVSWRWVVLNIWVQGWKPTVWRSRYVTLLNS